MIFKTTNQDADPVRQLAARIAGRVTLAAAARYPRDSREIRELAHAVAWQWVEETGRTDASPAEWLPRVCRALSACGAPETAALLMLFDTRLVWPARWTFHGEQPFWILDCSRLTLKESEKTALMLDRCLTTILARLAPLWDAVAGNGTLGLRRAAQLAVPFGEGRGGRRREPPLQTLRRQVADRLTVLARRRGWTATPAVILLQNRNQGVIKE